MQFIKLNVAQLADCYRVLLNNRYVEFIESTQYERLNGCSLSDKQSWTILEDAKAVVPALVESKGEEKLLDELRSMRFYFNEVDSDTLEEFEGEDEDDCFGPPPKLTEVLWEDFRVRVGDQLLPSWRTVGITSNWSGGARELMELAKDSFRLDQQLLGFLPLATLKFSGTPTIAPFLAFDNNNLLCPVYLRYELRFFNISKSLDSFLNEVNKEN